MVMSVVEPVSVETIFSSLLRSVRADLPEWSGEETDPLYKALQNYALREFARRELENAHALALDPRTAVGEELDAIGLRVLLPRRQGESDAAYRVRMLAGDGLADIESAGLTSYYVQQARLADSRVQDVGVEAAASPARAIRVYLLSSESLDGAPSATLRAAVEAYLRHRMFLGYTATSPAPAITRYTVTATLDVVGDLATVEAAARASVYAYIRARRRFGRAVRVSGLIAALSVAGVESVALSAPASDLTPAADDQHTVYYCPTDETSVSLTVRASS